MYSTIGDGEVDRKLKWQVTLYTSDILTLISNCHDDLSIGEGSYQDDGSETMQVLRRKDVSFNGNLTL